MSAGDVLSCWGLVFSVWGLVVVLLVAGVAWWLAVPKLGINRDLRTMVSTLFPALAIIVSIWSYGAQALSSREQIASSRDQVALLQRQLDAQREDLEIRYAEIRDLVTFQAEYEPDWSSLTLKKSDKKAFEVEELHLIPNYQIDEVGIDGEPIRVRPTYATQNGEHVLKIPNILPTVCQEEERVCTGKAKLRRLKLDFKFDGDRHRVVAIPAE